MVSFMLAVFTPDLFLLSVYTLFDVIWVWMNNNNLSFACEWRFELTCQCFATQRDFKLIIHTKWDEVVFSFFSTKKKLDFGFDQYYELTN